MAIRLKQAGIHDFTILERADRLGGTWRDNTYPGVACDIPSHLYSYSFEPNPNWSRLFAPQEEILAYLEHCADKYGVRPHIRFGTAVTRRLLRRAHRALDRQDERGHRRSTARVLVSGSGHALSQPVLSRRARPRALSRQDDALGAVGPRRTRSRARPSPSSARARARSRSSRRSRRVGRMHVFQRTAAWVQPKPDRVFTDAPEASCFRDRPSLQKLVRRRDLLASREPCARLRRRAAPQPAPRARLPALPARERARPGASREAHARLPARLQAHPHLERLLPRPPAGERRARDRRDRRDPRAARSSRATAWSAPVDAIIYATGFETAEAKPPFPIAGRAGSDLARRVAATASSAYAGTTMAGFPNAVPARRARTRSSGTRR